MSRGRKSIYLLLLGGIVLGVVFSGVFSATMHFTSTDSFCLSCHNHDIPFNELKTTAHFANEFGISPGCADCHLPHSFIPKMKRKVAAAKEVYGHITGVIDTDEKYLAHREEMKAREIARLKASDSAECRYCHNVERMDLDQQSKTARNKHQEMLDNSKTCIDCHQGIAHTPAIEEDDFGF